MRGSRLQHPAGGKSLQTLALSAEGWSRTDPVDSVPRPAVEAGFPTEGPAGIAAGRGPDGASGLPRERRPLSGDFPVSGRVSGYTGTPPRRPGGSRRITPDNDSYRHQTGRRTVLPIHQNGGITG